MKQAVLGLLLIAVVGGVIYFVNNKNSYTQPEPTKTMTGSEQPSVPPTSADTSSLMTEDVKTINIEAGSFYYKPNIIEVTKGEKIKIVMKSVSMMHDFNIDELGVKMPITKNGDTGTVEFTADKAGTFEYYCSVGQHRANGQVGKITVK